MGNDDDIGKFDKRRTDRTTSQNDVEKNEAKLPLQNMIIVPPESSWLGFWKQIVYICLFIGFFIYPYFLGFPIS